MVSEVKVLLKLTSYTCGVTILETRYSTFSPICCFRVCIVANCSWSSVYCVFILCVFLLPNVCCFTMCVLRALVAGLLAGSQYPESTATGHLGTGFSWFPCVYKRMLKWFPRFQVATTCFSCSPPDLNLLDPYFILMLSLFHIYVRA